MTSSPTLLIVDGLRGLEVAPVAPVDQRPDPRPLTAEAIYAGLLEWEKDFVDGNSSATVKAVRSDWSQYLLWCEGARRSPLPCSLDQLIAFLDSALSRGRKRATLDRYIYTVGLVHDAAGLANPTNDRKWKAKRQALYRRAQKAGLAEVRQAVALRENDVHQILDRLGDSLYDLRDAALISLASDTLCRESELVDVACKSIQHDRTEGSWSLRVGRSKTNQDGTREDYRFVSAETMQRIDAWKTAAGIVDGPIFLSIGGRRQIGKLQPAVLRPQQVARIFRRHALRAGLPDGRSITGHSTRVGTALDLVHNGSSTREAALAGGWSSEESVSRYTRKSDAGRNAVARLRMKKQSAP